MNDSDQAWAVRVTHVDAKEEIDWGPFFDLVIAQKCIANMASNPSVLQARIADLNSGKRVTAEMLKKAKEVLGMTGSKDNKSETEKLSFIEFNINDDLYVKLTDAGREEFKRSIESLGGGYIPEEDSGGWSDFPLVLLIQVFGHMVSPYGSVKDWPFETVMRLGQRSE